MKTSISILISIICISFFTQCTERVDNLDVKEAYSRYVIYGKITTDTMVHEIRITKTADYFANKPAVAITGATVKIFNGSQYITLTENPNKKGYYQTPANYYGKPGLTYTLTVTNVEGNATVFSAVSVMPDLFPIDSISLAYRKVWGERAFWMINLHAQEPSIENFYNFKVIKNEVLISDSLKNYSVSDDRFFNGKYMDSITVQSLDQDIADEVVKDNDVITLELDNIPKAYYKFLLESVTELQGQNPMFSGPPANVSTNIEGGALGFFTTYSIVRASKRVHLKDYDLTRR
jgi:hypothetical protein